MLYQIFKNGPVEPKEIEDLREAVGWDRCEGVYEKILRLHYAYYIARSAAGALIGYVSMLSDGVADALMADLIVHPDYQKTSIGRRLVQAAINDTKDTGIRCLQVTFDDHLEAFYKKCGFHIFKGGIIDFKYMKNI